MKKKQVDVKNAEVVKRDAYIRALKKIVAGGFCPFCEKHLFKHHKRPVLYMSKFWLVTENAWPYKGTRFHFLFIPLKHIEEIGDMSPVVWKNLQTLYREVVEREKILGGTLMIRSGDTEVTGASVNHLHAHLVVGGKRTKKTKPIRALVGFEK